MINQTIATAAFNQFGLDAMGIASGQLASVWSDGTPQYDAAAMTLTLAEPFKWKAMTGGILQWSGFGAKHLTDKEGIILGDVVGVFTIHPQAALRLRRLTGSRYDGRTDGLANRPVPFYAALREGATVDIINALAGATENDPPLPPAIATVGTDLGHGILTFHDEQGLIIDPLAVASLYKDLMQTFQALLNTSAGSINDLTNSNPGTIGSITAMGSGTRLHLIDAFGNTWQDVADAPGLRFGTGARLSQSVNDWPDAQILNLTDTNGSIRFGFSPEGLLRATPIPKPAFPSVNFPSGSITPNLAVQFFRAMVMDLKLHLVGNRSTEISSGVPGVDPATARDLLPIVREGDEIQFLTDGQSVMGAVNETATSPGLKLAVSPLIFTQGVLPTTRNDRWPSFPASSETAKDFDAAASRLARTTATAGFVAGSSDVVVTWPPATLPAEAHVRIFPRVDPGPAIVPLAELEFAKRGDGAAGIVHSGVAFSLLLKDPFNVGTDPRPSNPALRFDMMVVTRNATVKSLLLGGLEVKLGADVVAPVISLPANSLNSIPLNQRGISPSPLLGIKPTAPASGTDAVLNALGEAAPREAPRFRTMSRNDTLIVGHDGNNPGSWNAVITPGWLDAKTVRGDGRLGNPGNQAGPEEYSPGLKVSGLLALDIARAALRRTHHLSARLPELNNDRWNVPATGAGSMAGVLLQNIADTVESPEFRIIPESVVNNLPADWNGLITAVSSFLPSSMSSLPGLVPVPGAGDRWVQEVKRDAMASKIGRRDSQWSLRWALSKARKLIYLETPLFGTTASEDNAHQVDLIKVITERLQQAPDLRVIIAVPKRIPFGAGYESFAQRFYIARNQAIASLQSAAPKRIVVYQPIGFPGRPEVIRGTLAVVDDVWSLVGSSSFSRRGLTFDGSIDIALIDKTITSGISRNIRLIRKQAMARTLNLAPPIGTETANANWVRLSHPVKAFQLIQEILDRGGDGFIEPVWPGLSESELPALDRRIADPEGRDFSAAIGIFTDVLSGLGQSRV